MDNKDDREIFCYNAVRRHRKNIIDNFATKEIGFIILREDFFDHLELFPKLDTAEEIWSHRDKVGGENFYSIYFSKLCAIRGTCLVKLSFKEYTVKGVGYAVG
jgi:hypothetical protein